MRGIGKKIKKLRELKNFTQEYVAKQLGVTQSQYSRYENESSSLTEEQLQKLSEIFEMSIEDLEALEELIQEKIHLKSEQQKILYKIDTEFKNSYISRSYLNYHKAYSRFFTVLNLISKTYCTEEKILSVLENRRDYRVRAYKSHNQLYFSDLIVIEKVFYNTDYGYFDRNPESNLWIINPIGCHSRGINHFCYTLYDNLNCNYVALTEMVHNQDETLLKYNRSKYYEYFGQFENYKFPKILNNFLTDMLYGKVEQRIAGIQNNEWVFIIASAASGREGDIIIEYGKPQFSPENDFQNSTIQDYDTFLTWKKFLLEQLNSEHLTYNKSKKNFSFRYAEHLIGNKTPDWLGQCIHRNTKERANVVTIYINADILIGQNDIYYAMLKCLLIAFKEVFSIFVKEKAKVEVSD